ncbi:hypothetical protein ACM66B_005424 [Microbotryomycetes sp. NB124-2]
MFAEEIATFKRLGFRHVLLQALNFSLVLSGALMMWKGLGLVCNTESPVVVVLSESMEPAIQRGDLLFLTMPRKAPLRLGDITVYKVPGAPVPIVHRVIETHDEKGSNEQWILTKGDNNMADDIGLYNGARYLKRSNIVGRVSAYVPYVGYVTILLNDYPKLKYALLAVLVPVELPELCFKIARSPIAAVAFPLAIGNITGLFTKTSIATWYKHLRKPPGQPPSIAFPIVWTILYASMGWASHLLVKALDQSPPGTARRGLAGNAFSLYWLQYALNVIWTPLFFGAQKPWLSLIDISVLTPMTFALARDAFKVDETAGWLLAPYCGWLLYATYLNASIAWLNFGPKRSGKDGKAL